MDKPSQSPLLPETGGGCGTLRVGPCLSRGEVQERNQCSPKLKTTMKGLCRKEGEERRGEEGEDD